MVLEGVDISASTLFINAIGALFERFTWLFTFIKAVGIFVVVYAVYLIIKAFRDIKMRSRIKLIESKVITIDQKLDLILKKPAKAEVLKNKVIKKTGDSKDSFFKKLFGVFRKKP